MRKKEKRKFESSEFWQVAKSAAKKTEEMEGLIKE